MAERVLTAHEATVEALLYDKPDLEVGEGATNLIARLAERGYEVAPVGTTSGAAVARLLAEQALARSRPTAIGADLLLEALNGELTRDAVLGAFGEPT